MRTSSPLISLQPPSGKPTEVRFDFNVSLESLVMRREADLIILSTEEGFSQLGGSRNFFTYDLGIPYDEEIRSIAYWNRFKNEEVSLIAFQQRNQKRLLRGIILAPGENCLSYQPYRSLSSNDRHVGKPSRDYYYSVAYQAISHACTELGARRLAISHLSSCGRFHRDMATCQIEALVNFCLNHPLEAPETLTYFGCCIDEGHFIDAENLVSETRISSHRKINTVRSQLDQATKITINW